MAVINEYIWFGVAIAAALVLGSVGGFVVGYGFRRCRQLIAELRGTVKELRARVADSDPQVIDDTAVAQRKAKARANGDDDEPVGDQVITTKTPAQRAAEADAARESRLDKWMPGVKRRG